MSIDWPATDADPTPSLGLTPAEDAERTAALAAVTDADEQLDDPAWAEEEGWFSDTSLAFVASLLTHMVLVLLLALLPLIQHREEPPIVLVSPPPDYEQQEVEVIDQITYSDLPHDAIGANSDAMAEMAEASAEMFAEVAEIPSPVDLQPTELGTIDVNHLFQQAVAPLDRLEDRKGKVGQGTQGAAGAVDRLTFEILRAMEERPTLVVWLFDKSGSLNRQRQEIRDRFDRIYEELGIVQQHGGKAFDRRDDAEPPLLTSIIGFGQKVELLTKEPTADLEIVKQTVDQLEVDATGVERVFSAVYLAANEYKALRRSRGSLGPQRNVLLVAVTDERGDDVDGLEPTVELCRKWGIPVYVIGVPAPFGREQTFVKYVDPDPKYDQTPQWAEVDQGPETLLPERVQLGFADEYGNEPMLDSGFGPYALTRLCYETGGIYFTVHPNRNAKRRVQRNEVEPFASNLSYFFDPVTMARYQPDYVAPDDYMKMAQASPLRQALINAARVSRVGTLERPQTRFVKRNEAAFAGELSRAQQAAARIEPRLAMLYEILRQGEAGRETETSLRWQAGFDLALGRVLAHKVRAETYNAMLAQAKRGMAFSDAKNNTWVLQPSAEVSVGSKWQRESDQASALLQQVVDQHPGTPWAMLAQSELKTPIGWTWEETFTDLTPPPPRAAANSNNNPPRPPRDDQKRMLQQAPKRPVPKL